MQRLTAFSPKQMKALCWWASSSPYRHCTALICDGAVRSGKTLCMGISFFLWADRRFSGAAFALCGKTIGSIRRNLLLPLLPVLRGMGFTVEEKLSRNLLEVRRAGRSNRFYLFGGRDESSAGLIQGMTLSGVLFDEVALMPRSFVEQALARCSVEGARYWFNCNPESPGHWFYTQWICKARERNALYLHFTMEDNPSLSQAMRERYRRLFTGPFYQRFIEGKWVAAQGLVYPFAADLLCDVPPGPFEDWTVSCDYGTVNPASFGLWGKRRGVWYRVDEYYFDSRVRGEQRTDEEHYQALERLCGDRPVSRVVVDPSAASFLELLARRGRFTPLPARNEVTDGIRRVSAALKEGRVRICRCCVDAVREFGLYRWKDDLTRDVPVKENDHAMDDIRYFVSTVLETPEEGPSFFAVTRNEEEQKVWDF